MSAPAPAPVSVSRWGELPAERKLPGTVLRVLVAGESAGGVERKGGAWVAYWSAGMTRTGVMRDRLTEHASAEEAVKAVTRSAWARRLGARAASRVHWSERARRAAALTGRAPEPSRRQRREGSFTSPSEAIQPRADSLHGRANPG